MKTLNMAALVITLSAVSALAQAGGGNNSVSGIWKVSGDVAGNAIEQVCTFTQDGKKLTGSCKSADNKTTDVTGEVNEKSVKWQYDTDYEGQKLTVVHTGTLDAAGSQVKGEIDVQPMSVSGTFSAQKQEAKKEEPKKS